MRTNIIAHNVENADDVLLKFQIEPVAQRLLESQNAAIKRGAKSVGSRVNHADDVSRTPSRKIWQQKNFLG